MPLLVSGPGGVQPLGCGFLSPGTLGLRRLAVGALGGLESDRPVGSGSGNGCESPGSPLSRVWGPQPVPSSIRPQLRWV